jgi:hypothetical protein
MPHRGKVEWTKLIIYITFYGKLDALVFFDFVAFNWFIQNQIKRHAASPHVGGDAQVAGIDLLIVQKLFQVLNRCGIGF